MSDEENTKREESMSIAEAMAVSSLAAMQTKKKGSSVWEKLGKATALVVGLYVGVVVVRWEIEREVTREVQIKSVQIENTFKEWTGIWKQIATSVAQQQAAPPAKEETK